MRLQFRKDALVPDVAQGILRVRGAHMRLIHWLAIVCFVGAAVVLIVLALVA